jgi:ATP:ADP antiporter, AAA family
MATVVSAAMIAQQVSGKAVRDALFLTSFEVTTLPSMMMAAAVLSLLVVVWFSTLMVRHGPGRVVPVSFAISSVAFLAEWAVSFPAPRVTAVTLYLHTALFGASVISAFWSLMNEKFDPHTGKRAVSWIAGGGTLGGVLGGLLAWRAASLLSVKTMLPLLAAGSFICFWGSMRLRERPALGAVDKAVPAPATLSALRTLRDVPYLRNLALVVALGASTSAILDYVFSAEAVARYSSGADLLRFFSLFWLLVGALSFALQMTLGRLALEKLGLAATIALLPGVVILGGAFGLAVPGLASVSILRGGEATQRNSLFRAAYELLYTPLSEQQKRSTKTLIDVGFDRLGTVVASGIVIVTLALAPLGALHRERASAVLLGIAVVLALLTVTRSRPLSTGYVGVLQESLRDQAEKATHDADAPPPPVPVESVALRDRVIEHLDALPATSELATIAGDAEPVPQRLISEPGPVADGVETLDASLRAILALQSGDTERVRAALLTSTGPIAAPLVSFAILLLADKELHRDAIVALRRIAGKATGQLVDALCDPDSAFDIRRRIPRALSACTSPVAVDGLLRGTTDLRFEVRYACGQALLKQTGQGVVIPLETVLAIVKRETEIGKEVWESQPAPDFDDEEGDAPALIDRLLRDRIDRSMEHIFTLLALRLDRESLRIAFEALHGADERRRGTALEYLETVLPDEIRDRVWPFLGEARPMRAARPATEILEDLRRARA